MFTYTLVTYPDGGLRTSIESLTKHFQAIMKAYRGNAGPTLNPAQAQRLVAPHFPDSVRIDNDFEKYNSGLFIEIEGPENVGHTGGDPGVATLAFFDPATDVGMILFFNRKPTKRVASILGKTVRTIKYFASKF